MKTRTDRDNNVIDIERVFKWMQGESHCLQKLKETQE
jgi:hypothetical protein